MVAFNFDARKFEPNTGSADVLPTGEYAVQITGSEIKQTKSSGGYMLVFTCSVIEGEHVGRRIVIRLNIHNPNPQAVEIAHRDLSAISYVAGVPVWQDSAELHGKPFRVRVEAVPRSDKPELMQMEIREYLDRAGNGPHAGGATVPAPAAPQTPPAAPVPAPAPAPVQVAAAAPDFAYAAQQPANVGQNAPAPAPTWQPGPVQAPRPLSEQAAAVPPWAQKHQA